MSLLNETSNGSFTNSLFMVVPAAILFNSHRKPCAAGFLVVVDSYRQRRKRMANSCLSEMQGPANAGLLSRMKPAGSCADSTDATQGLPNPSSISKSPPIWDRILSPMQLPRHAEKCKLCRAALQLVD